MIFALVPLLLLAAVVAAVVLAVQRRGGGTPQLTGDSVRRFFQYLILAGLLFAAGSGLTGLLGRLLRRVLDPWHTPGDESILALQITFTVIALPLWAALAWWTHRRHRSDPQEGRAELWTAYLTLVLVVSLLVVLVGWQSGVASLVEQRSGSFTSHSFSAHIGASVGSELLGVEASVTTTAGYSYQVARGELRGSSNSFQIDQSFSQSSGEALVVLEENAFDCYGYDFHSEALGQLSDSAGRLCEVVEDSRFVSATDARFWDSVIATFVRSSR